MLRNAQHRIDLDDDLSPFKLPPVVPSPEEKPLT
jgi:hypothetical protein